MLATDRRDDDADPNGNSPRPKRSEGYDDDEPADGSLARLLEGIKTIGLDGTGAVSMRLLTLRPSTVGPTDTGGAFLFVPACSPLFPTVDSLLPPLEPLTGDEPAAASSGDGNAHPFFALRQ